MLQVEYELQKKDLSSKEDLLLNTYRALDAQKQQIESMKAEHDITTQELQSKIESLEKVIYYKPLKLYREKGNLETYYLLIIIHFDMLTSFFSCLRYFKTNMNRVSVEWVWMNVARNKAFRCWLIFRKDH